MSSIPFLSRGQPLESGSTEKPKGASVFRWPLLKVLDRFRLGQLTLVFPDGVKRTFGGGGEGPEATILVRDESFFKKCVLYEGVGMGESYIDGDWDSPNLRAVYEWLLINLNADQKSKGSAARFRILGLLRLVNQVAHALRPNSKTISRRNIAEHYDLGNDFYQLWLDPSMTYSSARYTRPLQTLEEAQNSKYEALCRKLKLKESDHVLEIGCGWGGFSLYAATNYGCRVTAVTISPAQYEEAVRRVKARGLEDRVEVRLQDYRDITGRFDKIASIEMLEAVGDRYLETWCAKCHELLEPDGLLAVQMITVPDRDHAQLKKTTDFIQRHVFPGSLLLAVGRMNQAMNRTGDFFLHGLEDLGASYARTLREWRRHFVGRLDDVRAQGFSERFIRKWDLYLQYCEAGFAARGISVVQAVYTRRCNPTLHREDGVIC